MGTQAADAVLNGEVQDEQDQAQLTEADKEAAEAFAAGFNRVKGKEAEPEADSAANAEGKPEAVDTTAAADATAQAAADAATKAKAEADAAAKAADDEWAGVPKIVRDRLESLGSLPDRLRGIEGNIGGLKSKLDTSIATAKAAADKAGEKKPTDTQIADALADEESFAEFERDFPDFAKPIRAQLTAIRAEVAKIAPVDTDGVRRQVLEEVGTQINGVVDLAEERAFTRLKHPDWKQVVVAPEFKAWLDKQPEDTRRLSTSPLADDAIALIDGYKAHRKVQQDADAARQRREKRVENAVPATAGKGGGAVDTGLSDEQAFELGFKRALGKKL